MTKKSIKQIKGEIFWKFRNAIHNGHIQVSKNDGKLESFEELPETSCYVCDIIHKLESDINEVLEVKP